MSRAFVAPTSLDAAVEAAAVEDALLVGGGVAVGLLSNLGLVDAARLVSLAQVPELRGVRIEDDHLLIGAASTHAELAADPVLRNELPELADLFAGIGNVRVRAWGTLGGNLALAEPALDPPVLLTALGAEVVTRDAAGERRIAVSELADGPMSTVLRPGELITAVRVRRPHGGDRRAYTKFLPRTVDDYATVSAAVTVRVVDGRVERAALVCGSVGPVPVRCAAAELLVGQAATELPGSRVLDELSTAVAEAVDPTGDHRGSATYKRRMAGVHAARAVERALGTGGQDS